MFERDIYETIRAAKVKLHHTVHMEVPNFTFQ